MSEAKCEIHLQDCITGMAEKVADGSISLTVSSIPFEQLFSYSSKLECVSNNGSTIDIRAGRFALNMRFVVDQLFRVHASGTNCCIHIQQLLAYRNQHGYMGRRDFRGSMIDVFGAGGFLFVGEVAIPKDPQQMAQRLNLHSLQFKTGYARTGTNLAPAPNDYVLIFQKPGDVAVPVRPIKHKTNRKGWVTTEDWIKWANGCWDDINQMDILDGWKSARETNQERHVCPLQLSVIERFVKLYTNPIEMQPDVTVLDPFGGIGSTGYVCLGGLKKRPDASKSDQWGEPYVDRQRNVIMFELKESYHAQAIRNVKKGRKMFEKWSDRSDQPAPALFAAAEAV